MRDSNVYISDEESRNHWDDWNATAPESDDTDAYIAQNPLYVPLADVLFSTEEIVPLAAAVAPSISLLIVNGGMLEGDTQPSVAWRCAPLPTNREEDVPHRELREHQLISSTQVLATRSKRNRLNRRTKKRAAIVGWRRWTVAQMKSYAARKFSSGDLTQKLKEVLGSTMSVSKVKGGDWPKVSA